MKVLVLMLVLDHEVLVLNIWSWSWRKSLAVFRDFCCNSWRQWAKHAQAFCERQQKQFAIWKPLFERTFCAPCTSASVERVFNNGGYSIGHTDASKVQCIDWGKLLSLGSKPEKQNVHGLKCHLEKCHKDMYTLYMRKVESRQQGPPAKRRNEVLAAHYRGWLGDWMYKKHKYYQVTFVFVFRPKMNVFFVFVSFSAVNWISFSSAFSFTAENEKCFSVGL